jgi:hypothetical protein
MLETEQTLCSRVYDTLLHLHSFCAAGLSGDQGTSDLGLSLGEYCTGVHMLLISFVCPSELIGIKMRVKWYAIIIIIIIINLTVSSTKNTWRYTSAFSNVCVA